MGRVFDGVNDTVVITRTVALEPATVTISQWFKGTREGNFRYALAKVLLAGNHASYGFHTGDGVNQIAWTIGWGTVDTNFYRQNANGEVLYDGGWHSLIGTYDPGQNPAMRIFIDGAEAATALVAGNAIAYNTGQDILLGNFSGLSLFKSGSMAEYAMWNTDIGSSAIASIGAGDNPLDVAPSGLLIYWRGKEDNFNDDSGNGNTITNSGSTFTADHPPVSDNGGPTSITGLPFFI